MFKRAAIALTVIGLAGLAAVATAQDRTPEFKPGPGVEMQIHLYPINKFRGAPQILTESTPRIRRPLRVESILLTRGIWLLCSDTEYFGQCVKVDQTRIGLPVGIQARSAKLIGDTGPLFVEAPTPKFGPDVPIAPSGAVTENRPAPAPVVAPKVEEGGEPGTNPSLAGREVEFFPAPARGGLRVLACAQARDNATPRCAQATADGFCAERGFRDSGWREMEVIKGRAYLANVLCKRASDSDGARDNRGIGIPFFGN